MLHQKSREFSPDIKQLVDKNLEQTKYAADSTIETMRMAIEAFSAPSSACNYFVIDYYRRWLDLAQSNADAWHDLVTRLTQTDSPAEWMAVQTGFARASFADMQRNAMTMIESCQNCASEIGKAR